MYAGLSGYELRIDSVDEVETTQSEEALYIIFSIRVSDAQSALLVSLYVFGITDANAIAALQGGKALCCHTLPHQLHPCSSDGLGFGVRVLRAPAPGDCAIPPISEYSASTSAESGDARGTGFRFVDNLFSCR